MAPNDSMIYFLLEEQNEALVFQLHPVDEKGPLQIRISKTLLSKNLHVFFLLVNGKPKKEPVIFHVFFQVIELGELC